jgi:hypothetical protein
VEERCSSPGTIIPALYFEQPGPQNTDAVLDVLDRASSGGSGLVLIASTSGRTGLRAVQALTGRRVVVVSHSTGYLKPDFQQMKPEMRRRIEEAGGTVLTCQHALGGVNRAVRKRLGSYQIDEIIAQALRIMGEGFKVAVEISLMAADAGLASCGEACLAAGGTGEGADTVVRLRPANAQAFFDLRILEILAKPRPSPEEGERT